MNNLKITLTCGVAVGGLMAFSPAFAEPRDFDVPAMQASKAIQTFARQAAVDVLASGETLRGVTTNPVKGKVEAQDALNEMLRGTQLKATKSRENVYLIKAAPLPKKISYAAYAEQQPAPTAVAPLPAEEVSAEGDFGLDEIIVTAQKRGERLQDVPIAITAITGDDLAKANISLVEQIGRVTPGLVINRYDTIVGAYLRGIGTRYSYAGLEATVGNYVDDLYSVRPYSAALDFVDIERIEVLKGPQGTLFGRNTAGGVIRVITKDPVDNFEGLAAATYGRYDEVKLDGVVNLPLGEKVESRFAVSYARNDGYVTNIDPDMHRSQDRNTIVASGKIVARPTDNLTLKLSGMYGRKNDWSSTLINIYPDYRNVGVALGGTPSPGFYVTSMNFAKDPSVSSYLRNASVAFRADLDLGVATLSSITGYQSSRFVTSFDVDTTEISWQHGDQWGETKALSQEMQIVSNGNGPLKWTAGLYYYNEDSWIEQDIFGTSRGAPEGIDIQSASTSGGPYLYTYNTVKVEAFAPYAQATLKVDDQWSITAGARYTWETKKLPVHYAWSVPVSGDPTVLINELPQRLSFKKFTPKIGVEFRPDRDVLLYAQWSRGYKSGGFNTPGFGAAPQLEPETLDAFEAGWKTEMGPIRFNGAAFYYDYKDMQIARSAAGVGVVLQNAASSMVYGAEAEIVYQPNDRFSFAAGGAWTHSEFTSFLGDALSQNSLSAACAAAGGAEVAGATAACRGFSLVPNTNFKGQPLPLAPRWTGNIRAQYTLPLSDDLGSVTLNSLISYTSKFNWGTGPTYLAESGYFLTTLGATWTAPDEKLEVGISADNVFDVKYRSAVVANTTGGYYYPGTPRWWRVRVARKF